MNKEPSKFSFTSTRPGDIPQNRDNLKFGSDVRFKLDYKEMMKPGPGQYNDMNKWNKRTYNLKFLNFQASA
mgnify:CR=1 FL=1